ncbi:spermidine synthase [Effusibacillus pohliae]|uniref:spermidine synthase n=1 Tax=Effusibacillus pohliae TaxID=232270 RepID=UPI000361F5A0|nr:fused MFS/spermidine synthase [Effusibacillus pohliae]
MRFGFPLLHRTKLIWKRRSPHQTVHVFEKGSVRYMTFASDNWQGALDMRNKERLLFPYQRFFLAYRAWLPQVRSFLSLGVGTGTAIRTIRRHHPDADIIGVDWDANVLQAAVRFFDCPCDERTRLYAMHGRAFLESADRRFDLVFLDVFDSFSIPKSMRSVECFSAIRDVMEENGMLFVNSIGAVRGSRNTGFRTLYKTVCQVFSYVQVLPVSRWTLFEQNILLIARKSVSHSVHPDACHDPQLKKMLKRLYARPIPTDDVSVYRDPEP